MGHGHGGRAMILIVTGTRHLQLPEAIEAAWSALEPRHPSPLVVCGDAEGMDRAARAWAGQRRLETRTFVAEWVRYRKAAGPRRNAQMIAWAVARGKETGEGVICLAFPHFCLRSAGTADTVERCRRAGVPVIVHHVGEET